MSATPSRLGFLSREEWKMSPGERAALEGALSSLRPALAIEVGTLTGCSLERIAAHSDLVHSFDIERHPSLTAERFPNVLFHTGDSRELLPVVLAELAASGQNVDFAFVDGDHSALGVQSDVESLLRSPSVGRTIILLHDTLNERVRSGLAQVDLRGYEKVRYVDLDFVPGSLLLESPYENELWGGLGLVLVGLEPPSELASATQDAFTVFSTFRVHLADASTAPTSFGEYAKLERRIVALEESLEAMKGSLSWRSTAPFRKLKQALRR